MTQYRWLHAQAALRAYLPEDTTCQQETPLAVFMVTLAERRACQRIAAAASGSAAMFYAEARSVMALYWQAHRHDRFATC
eukprot:12683526-Alexandrium_andersonii.AAC.1